jgi:hypothetical protein
LGKIPDTSDLDVQLVELRKKEEAEQKESSSVVE